MKLFETLKDLQDSGYIFRITDNGGESADRFTITFSDGDYFASSTNPYHPQGVGLTGEGLDVQRLDERVETGEDRDLRWIDLPEQVRECVFNLCNEGFSDWLESFVPPVNRADAVDNGTGYTLAERVGEGVYGSPGAYMIRQESYPDRDNPENDSGPFATLAEAVRATLPQDYDLSGPEYHTTVDLWDTEGGPAPLWDSDEEPPHPFEVALSALDDSTSPHWLEVGEARDEEHARELVRDWREANPELSPLYRATIGGKADRTFHTLEDA